MNKSYLDIKDAAGITNICPTRADCYRSFYVREYVKLDTLKNEIGDLRQVNISANIDKKTYVDKKNIFKGTLFHKIIYTSNHYLKTFHSVNFNVPFANYIDIEKKCDISIFIEDIYIKFLSNNSLVEDISLIAIANELVGEVDKIEK